MPMQYDEQLEIEAESHRGRIGTGIVVGIVLAFSGIAGVWAYFAGVGMVRFTSNVPDVPCRFTVDGRPFEWGGPEQALRLRIGKHEVSVQADGYRPFCKSFGVSRSQVSVVFVDLEPIRGNAPQAGVPAGVFDRTPRRLLNETDGSVLILIPEGEYFVGGVAHGRVGSRDEAKVRLPAFYLGLTEVTNAQYKRFIDATGHRPPDKADKGTPVWTGSTFPSEMAEHPAVCVSWDDASAYCRWAGLRLPTELEWEKGARGSDGYVYPWGMDFDEDKCCHGRGRGRQGTCRVWDYPEGRSVWGLYNMAGNAWEWCVDAFDERINRLDPYDTETLARYRRGDLAIHQRGQGRGIRGASWDFQSVDVFAVSRRFGMRPDLRYSDTGFRVARDVTKPPSETHAPGTSPVPASSNPKN